MTEDYKRGMCQCRSCNQVFHESERVRKEIEHLGLHRVSVECPHCNGNNFGLLDYPIEFEKEIVYKSIKFMSR